MPREQVEQLVWKNPIAFFAQSGRTSRSSIPDSRSTTGRVSLRWDIGRWPITSPVTMKSNPWASIHSFALLTMKILQSRQGLRLAP